MSKRLGNVVDAHELMAETGADPLRWYLVASSPIWLPKRFSEEPVKEVARKLLGTLRNVYSFFTLYASIDCFDPGVHRIAVADRTQMDRWLISRVNSLVAFVDSELGNYHITRAARSIQDFIIDDLSNWYVRRSRRRYWRAEMNDDKTAAYATLYEVLVTLARLLAPFMPFVAEEIYRNLVVAADKEAPESVHLCDYPGSDPALIDSRLEAGMSAVMRAVTLVRAGRNRSRIKVKQPLASVRLSLGEKVDDGVLDPLLEHLKEEVNVKQVLFEDDLSEYVSFAVVPRFEVLGPRLGDGVKHLKKVLDGLDTESIQKLDSGVAVTVSLGGEDFELEPDAVTVRKTEKEGFVFESSGAASIVLDVNLSEELLVEGCAREIVSSIQNLRKKSGFEVTDNIRIHFSGGELAGKAAEAFREHIMSETLAESIDNDLPEGGDPTAIKVGGEEMKIIIEKV
jgi:isoleucyl-tRNA synthetase